MDRDRPRALPRSSRPRPAPGRWASRLLGLGLLAILLSMVAASGCRREPDPSSSSTSSTPGRDATTTAPRPRIAAEQPVTSAPAREAGLLDDGGVPGLPDREPAEPGDPDAGEGPAIAVLAARDLEASVDFYRGVLGFRVVTREPAEPPHERVELVSPARGEGPALRLILLDAGLLAGWPLPGSPAEESPAGAAETTSGSADGSTLEAPRGAAVVGWSVGDLEAVEGRLASAAVAVGDWPLADGRRGLALLDPAGNRLLLVEAPPE